jgi:hypothetical protein
MTRSTVRVAALLASSLYASAATASPAAGSVHLELEAGAVWFSRNDVRIPGDTGTKFDMREATGRGPDGYGRIRLEWQVAERHALRLTWAPLEVDGRGHLEEDVVFAGSGFSAARPVEGSWRFDSWRGTWRWTFHEGARWTWGVGGTVLVRDARVALTQGAVRADDQDIGVVPLLHLRGERRLGAHTTLVLDVDGAAAPQGRAIDAALLLRREFARDWQLAAGWRTLEGGADNDDVYTFSWQHYAVLTLGRRF